MKTAFAIVLLLGSAATLAMGLLSRPAAAQPTRVAVPEVVMRALPGAAIQKLADAKPADGKPADAKPAEAKPAEAKPTEPKPAEPKPAEPKPAEPKPSVAKTAEPKPAEAKTAEAKPTEPRSAPVAAKPAAAAKPAPSNDGAAQPAAAAAPMGHFNLRASDTADVYVDGKKVGGSPVLGYKVKPGKHKIRFDCYDPTGESRPGVSQTYDVGADGEKDVEYDCPAE